VKITSFRDSNIFRDSKPFLGGSRELNSEKQNYFQGLIGVLQWICELGRLDILMPVSMLSR